MPTDEDARVKDSITFDAVSKSYGPVHAISDVSFEVPAGGFTALAGPNGSGKTTLLRLIAGLTRPTTGSVSVPGSTIGISFQDPSVYPSLTVDQNLSVFGDLAGADRAWRETLLDRLRLRPVQHRRGEALSAGFRKKLDLALALVKRPALCLLDEPLADLDDESRRSAVELFAAYAGPGRIVVVSSHRIERFDDVVDRLVVLRDGSLVLDRPLGALDEPASSVYRSALRTAADTGGRNA